MFGFFQQLLQKFGLTHFSSFTILTWFVGDERSGAVGVQLTWIPPAVQQSLRCKACHLAGTVWDLNDKSSAFLMAFFVVGKVGCGGSKLPLLSAVPDREREMSLNFSPLVHI